MVVTGYLFMRGRRLRWTARRGQFCQLCYGIFLFFVIGEAAILYPDCWGLLNCYFWYGFCNCSWGFGVLVGERRSWYKAHLWWGYAGEGGDSRNNRGKGFWGEARMKRYWILLLSWEEFPQFGHFVNNQMKKTIYSVFGHGVDFARKYRRIGN